MSTVAAPRRKKSKSSPKKIAKLSRTHKPEGMSLEQWQAGLRRQFATELVLTIRNLGTDPVFSEFAVANPRTKRSYRVAIRGEGAGVNYCSCPDYAVNTLGTCKHIEAVLHKLRRKHGAALRAGCTPPFAEVYVRYGARREVVFSPGADCPEKLRNLAGGWFTADGVLAETKFARFDDFLREAHKIDHELRVYDDAHAMLAEIRDGYKRQAGLRGVYGRRDSPPRWKKLLKVELHPYQREGALFAACAGRAIIADEMGLGKTIEAIAAAELLARQSGVERVLVVCPASLKSQWQSEIERFSGRSALVIAGLTHDRAKLYERGEAFFKIVNYDVIHRDLGAIAAWGPDLVILDEAQRIKNWQTRAAQAVKRIESRYAIVLTGTPLENRIEELHSIVEFVDRHRLGPLFAFKAAHEVYQPDSTRVIGYENLDKVTKTLAPILIRRTKRQVLSQLPPRSDKNLFVPMTPPQRDHHDSNRETVAKMVQKWQRFKFLTEGDQLRLRIALQNMRMSCDSTYLLDHETKHHTKIGELAEVLGDIFQDAEAKVVIFSQWVRMNELVAEMLEQRGWGHVHLHGGVPSGKRHELTRALKEDRDCRVFLSTEAGGVGLNLQTAATVVNMDLPWNPAVLEQRIGRVHRMGQRNPVRVFNFISESTIEQGMLALLAFKKSVFEGVLDGSSEKVMMGEGAMSRFMKTVESAAGSIAEVVPTPADSPAMKAEEDEGRIVSAGEMPRSMVGRGGGLMEGASSGGNGSGARSAILPADGGVQSLGALLTQGASLLSALGQALTGASDGGGADRGDALAAASRGLIVADPSSGRRELRLPLPDEAVLRNWMDMLSGFAGMLSARR